MPVFTDQTGRKIELKKFPQRIISVVPSQTEFLFDLGLENEVAGITKFCVHPEKWFRNKTRVGGTKQLKIDLIKKLQPDLIIANKEENVKKHIEELQNDFPVWISDVHDLNSANDMMQQIGLMANKESKAKAIIATIKKNFQGLLTINFRLTTAYLIWKDPYMTVGGDTFINSMLEAAGFENIFKKEKRYPEVTIKEIKQLKPEILLLSSEPYPFKQKHIDELQPQLPGTKILLVDGEMFSWYGSRLLYAPGYFAKLQDKINNPISK